MSNNKRTGGVTANPTPRVLSGKRKIQPVDFYGHTESNPKIGKKSNNQRPKMTEVCILWYCIAVSGKFLSMKLNDRMSYEVACNDNVASLL